MSGSSNVLIVGGGLAGSFLAMEMCRAGHQVSLVDREDEHAASRVAAGMFNIITGKMAAKTWMAEELLAFLADNFKEEPFKPLATHIHYLPIYRPFASVFELNEWTGREMDPAYYELVKVYPEPLLPEAIHNPLGGLMVLPCGWADTAALIHDLKSILQASFDLKVYHEEFQYDRLHADSGKINLSGHDHSFDMIVFCEGPWVKENPYFKYLDIRPLKGQLIEIQTAIKEVDIMISRGGYAVPMDEGKWLVGSTYEKKFNNALPDREGGDRILDNLSRVLKGNFRILRSWAGVRATTPNRRPVLGKHPDHDKLYVFNGLGTKGVLQAPFFARHFVQHFLEKSDYLIHDVSISRFDT